MVDADLGVLCVESEQILHLKAGCPDFGPVWGSASYPIAVESWVSEFRPCLRFGHLP